MKFITATTEKLEIERSEILSQLYAKNARHEKKLEILCDTLEFDPSIFPQNKTQIKETVKYLEDAFFMREYLGEQDLEKKEREIHPPRNVGWH